MPKWKEIDADAANIAAQRDAAEKWAKVLEGRLRDMEADWAALSKSAFDLIFRNLALEAELARIRAADRTSITVRTTEAAKMRKGKAI